MFKRALWIITTLALLLTACAGANFASAPQRDSDSVVGGESFEAEPAPMEVAEQGSFIADSTGQAQSERLVIRNADLSIVVPDPVETLDSIADMAENMGGFVVSSNLRQTQLSGGATVPQASITIRVPAEGLDEALSEIKSQASEVLLEDTVGQDVTQEYTDLQSRLRNLESAETQLTQIMEQATETEDVLQVYNDLVDVREQIEVIKGQIQYYEQAAALSAISVDITADEAVQPLTFGGWEPKGVAKDAIEALVNTLQWIGDALIWFGLCVLPVGLIALIPLSLVWFVVRRVRERVRKRKEDIEKTPEEEA